MEIRKVISLTLILLGSLMLIFFSVKLILTKISLPPYSLQTEGKYVAYSLQVWMFLWTLPWIASTFLASYLIFPSMFRRLQNVVVVVSVFLTIAGFGVTALLTCSAIINNAPLLLVPVGLSPLWITVILALLVYKKSKVKKEVM